MAVIHFLPKITKTVPAILVAVIAGTLAVITLGIETRTVGDIASIKGGFPPFHMPNVPFDLEMLKLIFPFAVTIAAVGLIESLLTLNLVDDLTETTGQPNRESVGQGLANSVTGLFGGMGGCAMVGQSIINVKSGGRGRLSGIVASLALLAFIVYLSEYVEMIPIAVLVGVMMMVVIGTFQWCTLRLFGKVPVLDVITGISVAVITLWTSDLALAVVVGVILSALSFAWESASKIYIKQTQNDNGDNIYKVKGTLFFASKEHFQELFDPKSDTDNVYIDFEDARALDHSAIQAIDKLAERYRRAGKTLHLQHLSAECRLLLKTAKNLVEVNILEDPTYHVADDKLA
jgi:SulP family sulfate permease